MLLRGNTLLHSIGNMISSSMNHQIVALAQFHERGSVVSPNETFEYVDNDLPGIVCGVAVCGSEDRPRKEYCK